MSSLGWTTLSDMISEVGRIVGDSGTGRRKPIQDALRRAYDSVAAAVEWPQLVAWDESGVRTAGTATVASLEAGEPEAPAPFSFGKLRSITIQGRQGGSIEIVQPGLLADMAGSQLTVQGQPRYAAQIGVTAQTLRLAASGPLTAYASGSSANDNTQTVLVEFRNQIAPTGNQVLARVSGPFTSGIALSADADAGYPVSKVVLPFGWAGGFQLQDGSGNAIVNVRPILSPDGTALEETRTISKPLYRFWPVPDQDYGLTWTWWRRPRQLVDEDDSPEMPVASYLVSVTAAEILRQMDKTQAAILHERSAESFIRALLRQNNRGPIHVPPRGGNFVSGTGLDIGR